MRSLFLAPALLTLLVACGGPAATTAPAPEADVAAAAAAPAPAEGAAHAGHAAHGEAHDCACVEAQANGGTMWCDHCNMGYVAGVAEADKAKVQAALAAGAGAGAAPAEPAGHAATCTCAEGSAGGTTWCDHCGKGYIDGTATKDKAAVEAALAKSAH